MIETDWEYEVFYIFAQSQIVLIIEGQLGSKDINGKFVLADKGFGYQGCETDIRFTPSKGPYKGKPVDVESVAMTL